MLEEYQCTGNRNPICPNCGRAYLPDVYDNYLEEEEMTVQCVECDEEFIIKACIKIEYDTRPVEGWNEEL